MTTAETWLCFSYPLIWCILFYTFTCTSPQPYFAGVRIQPSHPHTAHRHRAVPRGSSTFPQRFPLNMPPSSTSTPVEPDPSSAVHISSIPTLQDLYDSAQLENDSIYPHVSPYTYDVSINKRVSIWRGASLRNHSSFLCFSG